MKLKKDDKASLTVEAALVLPIFISVIITIAFFMKLVYVNEVVQHCITETANQIAVYSYIYDVSGLKERADKANDAMNSGSKLFQEHFDTVLSSYEKLNNVKEKSNKLLSTTISTAGEDAKGLKDSVNELIAQKKPLEEIMKDIRGNPKREAISLICYIGALAKDKVDEAVVNGAVKFFMARQLTSDEMSLDEKMLSMNIVDGVDGLSFKGSSLFQNEDKNEIDIKIKYKIDIPVPFKFLPQFTMVQRASVKAWLGGN